MKRIAFYAPMKSPNHPTPSGDRRMARLLMSALNEPGCVPFLASDFRSRDGVGDTNAQSRIIAQATDETVSIIKILREDPPVGWFTYHCYYKAPDLIGPTVARTLGIPYVIAEASRAKKRLKGPWAAFAAKAEAAMDAADVIFAMTPLDREALERDRPTDQRVVSLAPFVETISRPPLPRKRSLLSVAMMREGAKLQSYRALAAALQHLAAPWSLTIVGDGPARDEVEALFAPFGENVTFTGTLEGDALRDAYAASDMVVWPGIDEAFGMVYLEAQACSRPAMAENRPGPRSVIDPVIALPPPNDPRAFADAIEHVLSDPTSSDRAYAYVKARHSIAAARETLHEALKW